MTKQFLLASDFDQTLSFNDSGVVLSELIGFHSFDDKVKGLAEMNLVQQGAELSYLILHDPDYRRITSSVRAFATTNPPAKWIPSFEPRQDGARSPCWRSSARASASAMTRSSTWATGVRTCP